MTNFPYFAQEIAFVILCNFMLRRQFAWNGKAHFLGINKRISDSYADFSPRMFKTVGLYERSIQVYEFFFFFFFVSRLIWSYKTGKCQNIICALTFFAKYFVSRAIIKPKIPNMTRFSHCTKQ